MGLAPDITGRTYNSWTVLSRHVSVTHGKDGSRRTRSTWWCRCACGRESAVIGTDLYAGRSRSCLTCARRAQAQRMRERGIRPGTKPHRREEYVFLREQGIPVVRIAARFGVTPGAVEQGIRRAQRGT